MHHKQTQGTVTVDGVKLCYVKEGSGAPILVIGSAIYYPKAFSSKLREHFELIFVDMRHFVPSYDPPEEELEKLSLGTFVDDLEAARSALGVEKPAVLGHSVQAHIALSYAIKYPQHTSHLVLTNAVPYTGSGFAKEQEDFWNENASQERKAILARNLEQLEAALAAAPRTRSFATWYLANGPMFWRDPSFDAEQLFEDLDNSVAFDRLMAIISSGPNDVRETLERLEMPVLVILGRHDYAFPYPVGEELVSGLDNITYCLIDESGHNPSVEHPELFDRELISWFASH